MKIANRAGIVAGLLIFAQAATVADGAPGIKEILAQNHAATRAPNASASTTEKFIRIQEADYTLTARYRATADGRMRIDVFSGNTRVYSEGKDAEGVWEWPAGEDEPHNVYHDGVGALEHGIEFHLFTLAEFPERGHNVEFLGSETLGGIDYLVVLVTLSDGFVTYRLVNPNTWLVDISRDFRAFHPGIDSTKKHIETHYDRWRETDGVTHPTRSQNIELESGTVIATTDILCARYNVLSTELDLARGYVPEMAGDERSPCSELT